MIFTVLHVCFNDADINVVYDKGQNSFFISVYSVGTEALVASYFEGLITLKMCLPNTAHVDVILM